MSFHRLPNTILTGQVHDVDEGLGSDASESTEDDDDQTWDDWVSDPAAQTQCLSLFDDHLFPSGAAAIAHDKEKHGFDLDDVCRKLSLDFYSRTRLINYIRKEKPKATDLRALSGKEEFFSSDAYLLPTIEDDPLLLGSDDWSDDDEDNQGTSTSSAPVATERRVRILEQKLQQAKLDLAEYRKLVETRFGLSRLAEQMEELSIAPGSNQPPARDDDSHYFNSYGENDIHAVMIQDRVRTATYASFIYNNPSLFKDAVVLDVGCGTGILSLFAARAGAKRVFAVDASDIVDKAREIVKNNALEGVITVIKGKVEDIQLPSDVPHVDIIISEWMGYALLYESMLDSVLRARDRFLKPEGGVMVPSQCKMMLGLCSAGEIFKERVDFWSDVYGFDLSAMADEVYNDAIVAVVPPETLVSDVAVVKDLPLGTINSRALSFSTPFRLTSTTSRSTTTHAFILYFDTFFTPSGSPVSPSTEALVVKDGEGITAEVWRPGSTSTGGLPKPPVRRKSSHGDALLLGGREKEKITSFSTGPKSVPTHWKQTLFLLREPIVAQDGTVVSGTFHCRKSPDNSRELDVEIHYSVRYPEDSEEEAKDTELIVQTFRVR